MTGTLEALVRAGRKQIGLALAVLVLILDALSVAGAEPSPSITEAADAGVRVSSSEAMMVRELIQYLFTPETDLGVDSTSQARWLTSSLDAELDDAHRRCAEEAAANPDERYDLPGNSTFYDAWDPPTTFRLLGSRVYGAHALVDVEYAWGPDTNYPGDRRMLCYVLLLADGIWKLDDVVSVRGEFASPGSLSASLRKMP